MMSQGMDTGCGGSGGMDAGSGGGNGGGEEGLLVLMKALVLIGMLACVVIGAANVLKQAPGKRGETRLGIGDSERDFETLKAAVSMADCIAAYCEVPASREARAEMARSGKLVERRYSWHSCSAKVIGGIYSACSNIDREMAYRGTNWPELLGWVQTNFQRMLLDEDIRRHKIDRLMELGKGGAR